MGEYAGSSSFFKPCLSAMEMECGLDFMTSQFEEYCAMEIPSLGVMGYFDQDYLTNYTTSSPDHLLASSPLLPQPVASYAAELSQGGGRKRRSLEEFGLATDIKITHNKNSSRNGKRARGNSKEAGKSKEVVHVRARRGQATDSHSLAERSRRERINERMRSLQDLVPGCYKSMGMAGMLEEIINYVQSLQNQVEFLSLKLLAACSVYDPRCFDAEAIAAPQGGTGNELLVARDDYGGSSSFSATVPF